MFILCVTRTDLSGVPLKKRMFSWFLTGLLERLAAGESVVVAEGYLLEFERRGYLKAGSFVPEVVIENPNLVKCLHEEFVHAGSDVVEAFTVSRRNGKTLEWFH